VFDTARARTLRAEIDKMKYEYHAHGVELNRQYVSSAVVQDQTPAAATFVTGIVLSATTRPGASCACLAGSRLPSRAFQHSMWR